MSWTMDINLLRILLVVVENGNLTIAGRKIGLSQPAVSNALARLRDTFDDQLLIRTPEGFKPTPLGEKIIKSAREINRLADEIDGLEIAFDPDKNDRSFNIAIDEYCSELIIPELYNYLEKFFPGIKSRVNLLKDDKNSLSMLRNGELDLIISNEIEKFSTEKYYAAEIYSQELYKDRTIFVADKSLGINPSEFRESAISDYKYSFWTKERIFNIPEKLITYCERKNMILTLAGIKGLVGIVPLLTYKRYKSSGNDDLTELPTPSLLKINRKEKLESSLTISQYWHAKNNDSSSSIWLRKVIKDVCDQTRMNLDI